MTAVDSPATPGTARHAASAGDKDRAVPLSRLVAVELRKLADTRAGLWLLIVIGLASAATAAILLFAGSGPDQTFTGFVSFAQVPSGVLLPVLGILSMTGEWSQRTALTTFTLTPRRGRVIAAKLIAAAAIGVLAAVATFAVGALATLLAGVTGDGGAWTADAGVLAQCVLMQVLFVLMGSAFGALLMNTPLAIVAYFTLPMVWSLVGGMKSVEKAAAWLDLNLTSGPLTEAVLTGGQWARLAVSAAVWIVVPLVAGTVRVMRREVS